KSRTRSASASRSKTDQHDGFRQSPHTFSRGNFSRSSTSVRKPATAQNVAQLEPAGPPPTIATSKSLMDSTNYETALARDLIKEDTNSHGLVDSNPAHCRNPIADSHHLSVADRMDRICLLYARRLVRGGCRRLVYSVALYMRRVARVRARFGRESFWNQH